MIVVRIVSDTPAYDTILRQLPDEGFEEFKFVINSEVECDAIIVFDYAKQDIQAKCNPANVWLWNMEPPDEEWEWFRKGYKDYAKVITVDHKITHPKIIKHQLAIPWLINKTYKELIRNNYFLEKGKDLSFITSDYAARKGHRKRLRFLENISGKLEFDLWGRGFKTMDDKSEGLIPYKYSIVVENSWHRDYCSEKISDAFLCGCLPFYYGCPNIEEHYPPEALIKIDINKPAAAIEIIKEAIRNKEWEKRQSVIEHVRQKILNERQFFPVFKKLFKQHGAADGIMKEIKIPRLSFHPAEIKPFSLHRNFYLLKKALFRKRYLDPESPYFGFTTYK